MSRPPAPPGPVSAGGRVSHGWARRHGDGTGATDSGGAGGAGWSNITAADRSGLP